MTMTVNITRALFFLEHEKFNEKLTVYSIQHNMCHLGNIAMCDNQESVTTGQTDTRGVTIQENRIAIYCDIFSLYCDTFLSLYFQ